MVEEVPVMPERESAMTKAAAAENMTAAEAPAMKEPAAAADSAEMHAMTTAAVEAAMTASAVEAAMTTTAAAVTASAAMASAHFIDQSVGDRFRGRCRAWIDRRQRVCALDRGSRQHEYGRGG
jgi:septal ring-binding cell division protein DamX